MLYPKKGGVGVKRLLAGIMLLLCLSGCESESVSQRLYLQSIRIRGNAPVSLTMQAFDSEKQFSASGETIPEAIRNGEITQGKRIFTGHTELLLIGEGFSKEGAEHLLLEQGLSPGCSVMYGNTFAPEAALQSLRMSERQGMQTKTELSTALQEWMGAGGTALLPETGGGMVLVHSSGRIWKISPSAVQGMYWLRGNTGEREMTVGGENVQVLGSKRKRWEKDGVCSYRIEVKLKGCSESLRQRTEEKIRMDCEAAASEMLAAGADVIGAEDFLHTLPDKDSLHIEIHTCGEPPQVS